MMSIHELEQYSTLAEVTSTIEAEGVVEETTTKDEMEQHRQEHMDSLDLTDVFSTSSSALSSSSDTAAEKKECSSNKTEQDVDACAFASSLSSPSSSLDFFALHNDSHTLLRAKLNARSSAKRTSTTPSNSSFSTGKLDSDADFDDRLEPSHNDSRKLINLNIQRRATWSNEYTFEATEIGQQIEFPTFHRENDDNEEEIFDGNGDHDDDHDLSVPDLHNDSVALLKNLLSAATAARIFHRSLSVSDMQDLHNDSLSIMTPSSYPKDVTRAHNTKSVVDQLIFGAEKDEKMECSDGNGSTFSFLGQSSSRSLIYAMDRCDSLRHLAGVHPASRRAPLKDSS
mmetsp:Transcript_30514/g.89200  ORF Transcript_30514/g.89200 Transcript_30514/m.89200 type:complete len:341 (-) Transcript_30514:91-1113(-)